MTHGSLNVVHDDKGASPGGICIMVCPEVDLRKVHIDLRSGKGIPPNLHI